MEVRLLIERFSGYFDINELEENIIKELVTCIPADAGIFYSYDKEKKILTSVSDYGYSIETIQQILAPGEGIPGKCISGALFLNNIKTIEMAATENLRKRNLNIYRKSHEGIPTVLSIMATPIEFQNELMGVILLERFSGNRREFSRVDFNRLESLSNYISIMIAYLRLNKSLKDSKRAYRDLFGNFLASNEAERKAIAREIHDEINHILLSVKLNMEDMENTIPAEMIKTKDKIKLLNSYVSKAYDDLHRLSFQLRPPGLDDLGLPQALEWYISILSKEADLPIKLKTDGIMYRKDAPVVETALLRIAQEAITNAIKHAKAGSVSIKVAYTRQNISLEVEDDGKGFECKNLFNDLSLTSNLGLLGMKERAEMCGGQLSIHSTPGAGTRISTVIPISSYDWGTY